MSPRSPASSASAASMAAYTSYVGCGGGGTGAQLAAPAACLRRGEAGSRRRRWAAASGAWRMAQPARNLRVQLQGHRAQGSRDSPGARSPVLAPLHWRWEPPKRGGLPESVHGDSVGRRGRKRGVEEGWNEGTRGAAVGAASEREERPEAGARVSRPALAAIAQIADCTPLCGEPRCTRGFHSARTPIAARSRTCSRPHRTQTTASACPRVLGHTPAPTALATAAPLARTPPPRPPAPNQAPQQPRLPGGVTSSEG